MALYVIETRDLSDLPAGFARELANGVLAFERDLDAIREAWGVLKDWGVVPARITDDERGDETWQAYAAIEAALLRPEDARP